MTSQNVRRAALRAGAALLLAAATCAPALAQPAYPTKPVRIIVPSTPAGVLDNVARTLAMRLGDHLGQSIVIENKGGAGGNIGAEAAARSPADGYTLF
ncbi:MAG: Bug family tripartite tricarboxylate transporter substrate binding protein, partial [Methylibium sp.]